MKQKKWQLILVLLVTSLACNTLLRPISNTTPTKKPFSTPDYKSWPTPTFTEFSPVLPTEAEIHKPPQSSEINTDECDGNKWSIFPIAMYRYSKANENDLVIIDLAISNGSVKYWGNVELGRLSLTTENGEEIDPVEPYLPVQIPTVPNSPYSGTRYTVTIYNSGDYIVPPGFTIFGTLDQSVAFIERLIGISTAFRVPEAQSVGSLSMSVQIHCFIPQTDYYLSTDEYQLDLSLKNIDNGKNNLPTSNNYPDLGSRSIDVPELGVFVYEGQFNDENLSVLHFSFTNAGNERISGFISPTIIGDDGVVRKLDILGASIKGYDGSFLAGPNQTVDVNPVAFMIPSDVSNYKIVFVVGKLMTVDNISGYVPLYYDVYNFSP